MCTFCGVVNKFSKEDTFLCSYNFPLVFLTDYCAQFPAANSDGISDGGYQPCSLVSYCLGKQKLLFVCCLTISLFAQCNGRIAYRGGKIGRLDRVTDWIGLAINTFFPIYLLLTSVSNMGTILYFIKNQIIRIK